MSTVQYVIFLNRIYFSPEMDSAEPVRRHDVHPLLHFIEAKALEPQPSASGSHFSLPLVGAARFTPAPDELRRHAAEAAAHTTSAQADSRNAADSEAVNVVGSSGQEEFEVLTSDDEDSEVYSNDEDSDEDDSTDGENFEVVDPVNVHKDNLGQVDGPVQPPTPKVNDGPHIEDAAGAGETIIQKQLPLFCEAALAPSSSMHYNRKLTLRLQRFSGLRDLRTVGSKQTKTKCNSSTVIFLTKFENSFS